MQLTYEDYHKIAQFSPTDLAYIRHDEKLREFYTYPPSAENILKAAETRKQFPVDRILLWQTLQKQYAELDAPVPYPEEVIMNENTLTITTAHQPNLFTGPLFHIYKIASVVHLAKAINASQSTYLFVPVFVMSGEDHDWAELNHFHLFGKRYEWEKKASGPCGRFSVEGMEEVIHSIEGLFTHTPHGHEIITILRKCHERASDYGHFHRLLIAALFKDKGLIVLSTDDKDLKASFVPFFEKEIKERFSYHTVIPQQKRLEEKGFKTQAYCRPINLFYMTDGNRERLDPKEDGVIRVDTGVAYSMEEIINECHAHPERISPNVILRPLFQESILPNVAYVGGGGEMAYWLERKEQFAEAGIHYPMLIRRNSLLLIDGSAKQQLSKLGLEASDMFSSMDAITKSYLQHHTEADLDYEEEMKMLRAAFDALADKAEKIDPTLSKAIRAEEIKIAKQFDHLGSRLMRTEKHHQDTQLNKVRKIKEKLFPGGGLQERYENFLPYYASYGPKWIDEIIESCDPWKEQFTLVALE